MGYMIGVDVGGTFTDFSVFNQETLQNVIELFATENLSDANN